MTFAHWGDLWPWGAIALAFVPLCGFGAADLYARKSDREKVSTLTTVLVASLLSIFFSSDHPWLARHMGNFSFKTFNQMVVILFVLSFAICFLWMKKHLPKEEVNILLVEEEEP
jgi:drug/metabolite transporter (DMT)-like permease